MQLNPFHENFLWRRRFGENRALKQVRAGLANYPAHIVYITQAKSSIANLCDKYGSDKGGSKRLHNYPAFYELAFEHRCNRVKNVLECGIGSSDPSDPLATMHHHGVEKYKIG